MRQHNRSLFKITPLLVAGLLIGCAGPTTKPPNIDAAAIQLEAAKQQQFALQDYMNNMARLQRVGLPILHAAVPLCKENVRWTVGAWFARKDDFPKERQDAAESLLKMDHKIRVLLAPMGEPAAIAGMLAGDEIVSVNGKPVPATGRVSEQFSSLLAGQLKPGAPINVEIRRGDAPETLTISPKQACAFPLNLVEGDDINAFADGEKINVYTGMLRFASDDRDLAVVIGHELAHDAMRHIHKKRVNQAVGLIFDILLAAAGVNDQGAFSNMGAQAYSQQFEEEADYVGLYAVALANIDIDQAPNFWRKMAATHAGSIKQSFNNSHPSTPERFLHLEQTVAEIKNKRTEGLALVPDMKPATVPSAGASQAASVGFAPKN